MIGIYKQEYQAKRTYRQKKPPFKYMKRGHPKNRFYIRATRRSFMITQ